MDLQKTSFEMFYSLFWSISQCLTFMCWCFGILCLFHLHKTYTDWIKCSETSAYKIQTPGSHPNERIQRSEHGEGLQSRTPSRYSLTWISNLQLILGINSIVRPAVLTDDVKILWNSWIFANTSMTNLKEFDVWLTEHRNSVWIRKTN